MALARTSYSQIDAEAIDHFVKENKQEDLHLDFKRMGDKIDRSALAIALSGFANSDGGIVVWGVDARKDKASGVDAAQIKAPFKDARRLLSDLQSYTGDAVDPLVDGVEHKLILEDTDRGYLVTYVPASDSGPHMAKFSEYRYYKRSGDSFYRMEHYDLEDMFGRRPKPVLSLHARPHVRLTSPGVHEKTFSFRVVFGIENSGKGVAKYPCLSLSFASPYRHAQYGLDGNGRTGLPLIPTSRMDHATVFGGGADHVVYPGLVLEVTKLEAVDLRFAMHDLPEIQDLRVEYRIAAEGIAAVSDSYVLTSRDILELVKARDTD